MIASGLLAWSFVLASVSAFAVIRAAPYLRRGAGKARGKPGPWLLVRPCAGDEPWLGRALESTARAELPAGCRVLFAVPGPENEAARPAERAALALSARGIDAAVCWTGELARARPNHKVAQLEVALEAERRRGFSPGIVAVVDSDVDLEGAPLSALLFPVAEKRAEAVWAPPVERSASRRAGDLASAALLGASLHAFPLLAGLDPAGLVGKVFAVSAGALDRVGGFSALADYLGEDMELARRLRAGGGRVEAAPFIAVSLAEGRSFASAASRYARWLAVIRAQRPALLASYPALFFATPLVLLSAAGLALAFPEARFPALASALVALAARALVALAAARAARRPLLASLAASPLADALLALAFLRALTTRTVAWRSRTLLVERGGRIHEAPG